MLFKRVAGPLSPLSLLSQADMQAQLQQSMSTLATYQKTVAGERDIQIANFERKLAARQKTVASKPISSPAPVKMVFVADAASTEALLGQSKAFFESATSQMELARASLPARYTATKSQMDALVEELGESWPEALIEDWQFTNSTDTYTLLKARISPLLISDTTFGNLSQIGTDICNLSTLVNFQIASWASTVTQLESEHLRIVTERLDEATALNTSVTSKFVTATLATLEEQRQVLQAQFTQTRTALMTQFGYAATALLDGQTELQYTARLTNDGQPCQETIKDYAELAKQRSEAALTNMTSLATIQLAVWNSQVQRLDTRLATNLAKIKTSVQALFTNLDDSLKKQLTILRETNPELTSTETAKFTDGTTLQSLRGEMAKCETLSIHMLLNVTQNFSTLVTSQIALWHGQTKRTSARLAPPQVAPNAEAAVQKEKLEAKGSTLTQQVATLETEVKTLKEQLEAQKAAKELQATELQAKLANALAELAAKETSPALPPATQPPAPPNAPKSTACTVM